VRYDFYGLLGELACLKIPNVFFSLSLLFSGVLRYRCWGGGFAQATYYHYST